METPKTTEAYLMELITEFLKHDFTVEPVLIISYDLCRKYAELINKNVLQTIGKEIGQG